jgi:hypothetical protein
MSDNSKGKAIGPKGALKWPSFEADTYLSAQDLDTEQRYRRQRLRRHNRYLHGWGVVCGLGVVPSRESQNPWSVLVCPGYAVGPYGDEIHVPIPKHVNIHDYLWKRPAHGGQLARTAYVGIRYAEELGAPTPIIPPECGQGTPLYKSSRIWDCFRVDVLWAIPGSHFTESQGVCDPAITRCPQCPDNPYIILAAISLPDIEAVCITHGDIDNWTFRQSVF